MLGEPTQYTQSINGRLPNFNADLRREKMNEVRVGKIIATYYGASGFCQTDGRNSDSDFSLTKDGKTRTFELKTDYYTNPNHQYLFAEFASANRNCSAGLAVCKADYVAYDLPRLGAVALFTTSPLTNYITNHSGEYRYIPNAGDGSRGFIVPTSITGQAFCTQVIYY